MNIGRMKLSNWALFFVVAGALAAACTTKTTDDDDGTGGGTTSTSSSGTSTSSSGTSTSSSSTSSGTSSSSSGSTSCDTGGACGDCANSSCAQSVCGAELAACQNNPECIALNDCYAACDPNATDTSCYDTCDTTNANGVDDWMAWASCIICNPDACYGDCDGANSCA